MPRPAGFARPGGGGTIDEFQTHTYSYPVDSHRLTQAGPTPRSYDPAGNLTVIGDKNAPGGHYDKEYFYNDANRLKQVNAGDAGSTTVLATYKYNGRGEQVLRATTVSTIFVYDEAGHLLGQYGITGTPIQQYVWMDGQPVGVISGSSLHYVEADHLGTPRAIVDATRQVAIWTLDLATEPFGNTAPNVDPDGDGASFVYDLRFPGQRYDAASGLYYNYYRDYDPAVGRYTQTDPIGQMGGLAVYGYAGNSPLLYTDPTGEIIPFLAIIGGIWVVAEIALTIHDAIDTYQTVRNPCLSAARKALAVGLFAAGLFLPGGGYSKIDDVAEAATKHVLKRSGPKGVVPNRHNANVMVRGSDGEILSHERLVSGNMTPAEQALGFPRNTLDSHTEARAVSNTPLNRGDVMTITGQRAPCPSCKGYMNRAATETGATIRYQWREGGQTMRWTAGGR